MRLTLFILFFTQLAFAQKHDYYWLMGYQGGTQSGPNDIWGNARFDFNQPNQPMFDQIFNTNMNIHGTNSSICDSSGNLVCYTNGIKVFDKNHQLVQNGNNLVLPNNEFGEVFEQGALILPAPLNNKRYYLLSLEKDQNYIVIGRKWMYNTIDINASGQLKVTEKRKLLVEDSLSLGNLAAVKHANGRDWWVFLPRLESRVIYRLLLQPNQLSVDTFHIDFPMIEGLGQANFSPDGKYYCFAVDKYLNEPAKIYLFDFDRCTGRFSNQRSKEIDSPGANFGAGCAFSPDSRYWYVFHTKFTFQYDLAAEDVLASETLIGTFDGFSSGVTGSYFMYGQLGADGRIYVGSWLSTFHFHQVLFPHRTGMECQFVNHSIESPVYMTHGIPTFPNFRLGPIDGSNCDTLGYDNHPQSLFRWEVEDVSDPLVVTFTDLSSYEPDQWFWDFGDGTGALERYPEHIYAQAGVYEACLTVSNAYDSHTWCQEVYVGVSGSEEGATTQENVKVWPNPFGETLNISAHNPADEGVFQLFDVSGALVLEHPLNTTETSINTSMLPSGWYFWQCRIKGNAIQTGKIINIR